MEQGFDGEQGFLINILGDGGKLRGDIVAQWEVVKADDGISIRDLKAFLR